MSEPCVTDIRVERAIAAASDEQGLRSRLGEIVKRKGLQDVCVGVLIGGRELMLAARGATDPAVVLDAESASDAAVTAGCLAKSLTSTLMSAAVVAGRVSWTDFVADVLPCGKRERQQLAGVTLRHLLDHSHGLDASAIAELPYRADGYIDTAALCGQIDARSLSAPGQMYSYSHVGAWLAGAVLENIFGTPYASQLRERQLVRSEPFHAPTRVCPATGADLTLTVPEWLSFARRCMDQWQDPSASEPRMKLPGWHPAERSIWRGWKDYGEGWLGHNANLADRSAMLRVNAQLGMAIIVSAREASGAMFATVGLFSDLLPEFRALRPPRLLKPDEIDPSQLSRYVGQYAQARATVEIDLDAGRALRLAVIERGGDSQPTPPHQLCPAERGVFLSQSRDTSEFLFVQFIAPETSQAPTHLWNGRQLWRKVEHE